MNMVLYANPIKQEILLPIAPEKFFYDNKSGLYIYPETLQWKDDCRVSPISELSFIDALEIANRHGLTLLTSEQWTSARHKMSDLGMEGKIISGEPEFTDTLIYFDTDSSATIFKGNEIGFDLKLNLGNAKKVKWLPQRMGYIQQWSEEYGLPLKISESPSEEFHGAFYSVNNICNSLQVILRGHLGNPDIGLERILSGRYDVSSCDFDSDSRKRSSSSIEIRVASKTGKVQIWDEKKNRMIEHDLSKVSK